jgi:hypothetical protein
MPDTTTTKLALVKPEVGASTDTWGEKINDNLDVLDDVLREVDGLVAVTYAGASAGGVDIEMAKARGTRSSPTVVSSGDSLGTIAFKGYDGAAYRYAAAVSAEVGGTPGSSDMPGSLILSTTPDGSTTLMARQQISPNGVSSFFSSVTEKRTAISASDIDLTAGNYFTKTISGTTTFTVSNVPSSGNAVCIILDLTNGGSATINWWSNVKWVQGTAPTLTSSGRDVLAFFTHDAGTIWSGFLLGQDVR